MLAYGDDLLPDTFVGRGEFEQQWCQVSLQNRFELGIGIGEGYLQLDLADKRQLTLLVCRSHGEGKSNLLDDVGRYHGVFEGQTCWVNVRDPDDSEWPAAKGRTWGIGNAVPVETPRNATVGCR